MDPQDGQAAREHVRFGPNPTQVVPGEWADDMLAWLKDHHPLIFAAALVHASARIEISGRARRNGNHG